MNSVIQVLLSCPEFCQYLDDPRTIVENYETSNILRNILHQVKNSPNGSVVNITPFVSQLRMKYYGNNRKGGDDRYAFITMFNDLKENSPIFNTHYKKDIFSTEASYPEITIGSLIVSAGDFQIEFQNAIEVNKYKKYGKNIFIFMGMFYKYNIPKYLEFTDSDGNIRHYKLVGATCSNSRHATSCIMTNDEKILHINDSRISVHDFEDAQETLLNGKGPYQADFSNYRET